ncbi:hypothetical protein [Natrinema amylolyticum]|uniref:hypothetical protein n=1 Tax=Natrinema amylolyticum TaxID=2878679 RepID=UPI001CFB29BF|nr:hypothetical protein [Natrinema amylolyticum]
MWIQTDNQQLRSLYDADLMDDHYDPPGVEFSAGGKANVVQEVGERLVEHYDDISPTETDNE